VSAEVNTVVVRSDIGRYGIVPEWLLATDVSANAIRLFAVLAAKYADREGLAYPSRRRLREDMGGVSLDTIDRGVADLVRIGALSVEARRSDDGDPTSNLYTVHFVRSAQGVLDLPIGSRTVAATGSRKDAQGVAAPVRTKPDPVEPDPVEPKLSRAPRAPAVEIPTKLPTQAQIEREQHLFGRDAERTWLEAAEKVGSPYTDRAALRQVHEQAINATRWATEAQVLSAIRRRLDIKSSPRRIPEWARLEAGDDAQREHVASVRAEQPSEIIEPPRADGLRHLAGAAATIRSRIAS
jgi:hypothetical protein